MRSPSVPAWFNDAEVSALLGAAPIPWWGGFITLAVSSGLTVGEMLRLHWTDLDQRTGTVRVTSMPISNPQQLDRATLRTDIPAHRERFVPIDAPVFVALDALRALRPEDAHVFVPEPRLDRLWPRIVSGERLDTSAIAPWIVTHFKVVQRFARQHHAAKTGVQLAAVRWPPRPLAALRTTYAIRAARVMSPSSLAAHLGIARTSAVLKYFDLIAQPAGGAR